MKAYSLQKTGMDIPLVMKEYPTPELSDYDVLIQTKAIAINPVDIKTRVGGGIYGMISQETDLILGWDVAGVISAVGDKVSKFKVGDEVFGMVNFPGHGKAYATEVAAPENHLALKPKSISFEQAAVSTLAPLTAMQVLNRHVKVGMKVLIHGSSGGVGHFAVQLAKMMGAYVICTTSTKNIDFVKGLGADEVIDYTQKKFYEVVKDVDFVFDALAGKVMEQSIPAVKDGGVIISIPTGIPEAVVDEAAKRDIHIAFELVESSGSNMKVIAKMLEEGKLVPTISHKFKFEEIELAHKQIATGHTRGKIVVSL